MWVRLAAQAARNSAPRSTHYMRFGVRGAEGETGEEHAVVEVA